MGPTHSPLQDVTIIAASASPAVDLTLEHPRSESIAAVRADAVPWYAWCLAAASTSVMVGAYWDISWHMSIGRDTFWTPAHMAIYLGGVLAGLSCAVLILSTTFSSDAHARDAAINVFGFRGPMGAFIASWGCLA